MESGERLSIMTNFLGQFDSTKELDPVVVLARFDGLSTRGGRSRVDRFHLSLLLSRSDISQRVKDRILSRVTSQVDGGRWIEPCPTLQDHDESDGLGDRGELASFLDRIWEDS